MNNTSLFTNVFKSLFGSPITPTSSQYVPITANDGTPAGISSMANLASVLGAYQKWFTPIENNGSISIKTDSLETQAVGVTFAIADGTTTNLPTGVASNAQGRLLYIFTHHLYGVVFYMQRNTSVIYFNNYENGTWRGWYKITGTAV